MEQKPCIFCQIANKQIPAKIVYEDAEVIAFLDINPMALGHTLIIPKNHTENIFNIEDKVLQNIANVAKKISLVVKERLGAEGVNLLHASGRAAEQSIPHFHLHVVPRKDGDGINFNDWWLTKIKKLDDSQLEEIVKLIRIEKEEPKEEVKEEEPKIERSEDDTYWIRRELDLG